MELIFPLPKVSAVLNGLLSELEFMDLPGLQRDLKLKVAGDISSLSNRPLPILFI